jgi:hypothetical protein
VDEPPEDLAIATKVILGFLQVVAILLAFGIFMEVLAGMVND